MDSCDREPNGDCSHGRGRGSLRARDRERDARSLVRHCARGNRAVSPVVGVVLLVGVVALLGGVLGLAVTGFVADGPTRAPTVDATAARFVAGCPGCGPDDQVVRLEHEGGDPVDMRAVTVQTTVADRPVESRLVDLPVENGGCNDLKESDYEGEDIYEDGCAGVRGPLNGAHPDREWASGETIAFRIPKRDLLVAPGEELTVRVVHTESNSVVVEETLVARDADVS